MELSETKIIPTSRQVHCHKVSSKGLSNIGLPAELDGIRTLVSECDADIRAGRSRLLPGNVAFLADGRCLCRDRSRGDSRYPYGTDGFNLWVSASGKIHANQGVYFSFLPAAEGRDPQTAFFFGCQTNGSDSFTSHSLLPMPWIGPSEERMVDRYTVFGHDAAYFVAVTPEVFSSVRVFLDQSTPGCPEICYSLYVENRTQQPLEAYTSAYMNPFCRHRFVETNEDIWFKQVRVEPVPTEVPNGSPKRDASGVVLPSFAISTNEDVSRFQSITNLALVRRWVGMTNKTAGQLVDLSISRVSSEEIEGDRDIRVGEIRSQECTSRLGYIGSPRRTLGSARFLETGHLEQDISTTVFNDNAVVGDLLRFVLPTDSYFRADYRVAVPEIAAAIQPILGHSVSAEKTDRSRGLVCQPTETLQVQVQGEAYEGIDAKSFNHFWPFLKKQVAICATLKGYVNPAANSLIGVRDVFQAIEGHLFDQPAEAREKIIEAIGFVLVDGRCPRQYSLPVGDKPGLADLREYVDQGVWVISAIHTYLCVTGDASLLEEVVGYHEVSPTDNQVALPSDEKGTVLEHLFRIIGFLDRSRDPETGLVLALYGDWNDAIDGLGVSQDGSSAFGTGVTVMTSLQLYRNCAEMLELLDRFTPDQFTEQRDEFSQLRKQLLHGLTKHAIAQKDDERRVLHGWGDQRSFFVGSFDDVDGLARDGLICNAFWVLSDMLEQDPSMREDLLAAMERMDSRYGFKTFEPGFGKEARPVGRIVNVPIGSAENGAVYIHATVFAVAALFRMGEPRKAWEQIAKLLPFASHFKDPSHSPFVMPNSYLDNPELGLDGQSMDDWQTGSSNVILKLLIRYAFGFDPTFDHLRVAPAAWFPFEQFKFQAEVQGRLVQISYERGDVASREFHLNGERVEDVIFDEDLHAPVLSVAYSLLKHDAPNLFTITDPLETGRY